MTNRKAAGPPDAQPPSRGFNDLALVMPNAQPCTLKEGLGAVESGPRAGGIGFPHGLFPGGLL